MADDTPSGTRPFGFYDTFAQMLNDLAATKGYHLHSQLARAIDPKATETLEKNVGNWRSGKNLPSPSYLKPLAKALDLKPEQIDLWNRLYRKAQDDVRAQTRARRPAPSSSEEQVQLAEPETPIAKTPVSLPEGTIGEEQGGTKPPTTKSSEPMGAKTHWTDAFKTRLEILVALIAIVSAAAGAVWATLPYAQRDYPWLIPTWLQATTPPPPPQIATYCDDFAKSSFDPTNPSDKPGTELHRIDFKNAGPACKAELEAARARRDKEAERRYVFLNARVVISEILADRSAIRSNILEIFNTRTLYGTSDPLVSANRVLLAEEIRKDDQIPSRLDEAIRPIEKLSQQGYVPAQMEILQIEFDDIQNRSSTRTAVDDSILLEKVAALRANKGFSLSQNPRLLTMSCRIVLTPFFGDHIVPTIEEHGKIKTAIADCEQAQQSEDARAQLILSVANLYRLPGTPSASDLPDTDDLKTKRELTFLKEQSSFELRNYPSALRNIALISQNNILSLDDVRKSIALSEQAYKAGRDTLGYLCGLHSLDWSFKAKIPPSWEKTFHIDLSRFFNEEGRSRKMANFCKYIESKDSDFGLFYIATAHASGELADFGINRDVRRAAELFQVYRHDPTTDNKPDRLSRGSDRLGELCALYVRPEQTRWPLDRYRKTIETIQSSRSEARTRRDLDTVCEMAADADNSFSMIWLYLASIGAAEGFEAAPRKTSAAFDRLIAHSKVEMAIPASKRHVTIWLGSICRLYAEEDVEKNNLIHDALFRRGNNEETKTLALSEWSRACAAAIEGGSEIAIEVAFWAWTYGHGPVPKDYDRARAFAVLLEQIARRNLAETTNAARINKERALAVLLIAPGQPLKKVDEGLAILTRHVKAGDAESLHVLAQFLDEQTSIKLKNNMISLDARPLRDRVYEAYRVAIEGLIFGSLVPSEPKQFASALSKWLNQNALGQTQPSFTHHIARLAFDPPKSPDPRWHDAFVWTWQKFEETAIADEVWTLEEQFDIKTCHGPTDKAAQRLPDGTTVWQSSAWYRGQAFYYVAMRGLQLGDSRNEIGQARFLSLMKAAAVLDNVDALEIIGYVTSRPTNTKEEKQIAIACYTRAKNLGVSGLERTIQDIVKTK